MKLRMHRELTGKRNVIAFKIPEEAIQWALTIVAKGSKIGDVYDVTIDLPKRGRTTGKHSQSHHGNGHCMQIAAETGNSFEAVKLETKRMAMEQGKWRFETIHGNPWPLSEAQATVEEATEWIECCHRLADELVIILMEE